MPTFPWSKEPCRAHFRTPEAEELRALALGRELDKAREIQTHLRDLAGSVPDDCNKASPGIHLPDNAGAAIKLIGAYVRDNAGGTSGHCHKAAIAIK